MRPHELVLFFALLSAACSGETPGKVVQVVWQLEPSENSAATVETETGYTLQLEEARIGIAAAYAYAPLEDHTQAMALRWLSGVSVAHAHGGIDPETGRRVRAELLDPVVVDLLDPQPRSLPPAAAEGGAVDALKVELTRSGASAAQELHGGSAFVRGQAERDGVTIQFQASVALNDAIKARSIDLSHLKASLDDGVVLHVRVDPTVWLRSAEFERLTPDEPDAPVEVGADTQVGRALVIGVRTPDAFELHVTAK